MKVLRGRSELGDARAAAGEATRGWAETPELLLVFCSTRQAPDELVAALTERFPGVPIAGCTTAGELLDGEHTNGTLVVAGLVDSGVRWRVELARGLHSFDEAAAREVAGRLLSGLEVDPDTIDPDRFCCLLFVDGLSMKEELVSSLLADAIEGIPLAGGSAGDDLNFKRTYVLHEGGAETDAAVVVMGKAERARFEIIKHQHFVTTPRSLVITRADVETRTVHEIDGYPAARAYAAVFGLTPEQLTSELTFLNPLTFQCNGELYVRSIQTINEDGSITFFCGIEEGMVLDIGGHEDMTGALGEELRAASAARGAADFVLGFNCILRSLEAREGDTNARLGAVLRELSPSMIGFDTYGEQLNGLHINQTLVAVAIRDAAAG